MSFLHFGVSSLPKTLSCRCLLLFLQPVRPGEDYQMKDARVRRWAQEYIGEANTLERHRRADQPKAKSKN